MAENGILPEIDLRYFLNPESVSPHLFCSVCQEVFVDPQRAPCGHSFCRKCIIPWLKQSRTCPEDRNEDPPECIYYACRLTVKHILIECPDFELSRQNYFNCNTLPELFEKTPETNIMAYLKEISRRNLQEKDLHHDFILENIIGDQMVACPFRRHGCTHVGQLSLLSTHRKNCCFNPVNLPEFLRNPENNCDISKQDSTEDTENQCEDSLPTPAKPSLKMRLFQAGGSQRELLCSAFNRIDNSSEKLNRLQQLLSDDDDELTAELYG